MGPIVDRSKERLGQTDRAIIAARHLLLDAVRIVEDGGNAPGADTSYYDIRAIEGLLPSDAEWLEILKDRMFPSGSPI